MNTITINTTEDTIEAANEAWMNGTSRYEKLGYLLEVCSSEHIKECTLLTEIVSWMSEDDFDEFFKRHCSLWNIKTPAELEHEMNN